MGYESSGGPIVAMSPGVAPLPSTPLEPSTVIVPHSDQIPDNITAIAEGYNQFGSVHPPLRMGVHHESHQSTLQPSTRPKSIALANGSASGNQDSRIVVLIYEDGFESIFHVVADVLGKPRRLVTSFGEVGRHDEGVVIGITAEDAKGDIKGRDTSLVVAINTHCVDGPNALDELLSNACDYEFLYSQSPFFRRDLARFLSFTLGQLNHHGELIRKVKTSFIALTFPDVRPALSNLDILSVGADAVELRADLLKEPLPDGTFSAIPSLKYVGEQVMYLRQRTELPIIFTTRCTRENGKFPMDDPHLFYTYLLRAIQWGCEYIDVEVWLPEDIRSSLAEQKGNSRIISAFHDFSGKFKWSSPEALKIFQEGRKYSDIVKMIAFANSMSENYELEHFRSTVTANFPFPPLQAVNAGQIGQLSRVLNSIFSPITHPLLPTVAAPGQLSAAEVNRAQHIMGQMPKRDIYAIGTFRSTPQSMFFEKCLNELGLPHHFLCVDRGPKGSVEVFITNPSFGGAYINPPLSSSQPYLPNITDAARTIGTIDTIYVLAEGMQSVLVGDNATWKAIRETLTRDFVPSAYAGRPALILSNSADDAASAIFALRSLQIGTIYSVGFKAQGPLASGIEHFTSVESIQRVQQPFVIVSALPPSRSHLVQPLLRHFSNLSNGNIASKAAGKVFVDLANGPRKGDPLAVAVASGWTAYGIADISAWTTVETLRLLVGQNVPYDFVRMASGRGLY